MEQITKPKSATPKGLYIHIPFCVRKCPYCDFYSVGYSEQTAAQYAQAVIRNIKRFSERYDTVYFGGGTPVLMADFMGDILAAADITENAEITSEANPGMTDDRALHSMLCAGVDRISFGVQSLIDSELAALGRIHSSQQAQQAVLAAHSAGFRHISADLMLGISGQTEESLTRSIDELAQLPIDHISAYMLKIEPDTPYGCRPPLLPDEDETAELYLLAAERLAQHGFAQYEISNFARPGGECRHNLKYWRREEYIGIGAAAHSFYGGVRYAVPRDIAGVISSPIQEEYITDSAPDEFEELVMLGLRLTEGIPQQLWSRFEQRLRLIPKSYYRISDGRLSLTPQGFLVANEIISLLLSDL